MTDIPDEIRQPKKQAFLKAFALLGTVTYAAKAAGINRYDWLKEEAYREAFESAGQQFELGLSSPS